MTETSESQEATPPIDIERLMRSIHNEVAAKRASGDLTPEFEARLDVAFTRIVASHADNLDMLISYAEGLQTISTAAPTTSERPVVGKAVGAAKHGVQRAIAWNLQYLADQVSTFGGAVTRALRGVQRRVDSVERSLDELSATVDDGVADVAELRDGLARTERSVQRIRQAPRQQTPTHSDDAGPPAWSESSPGAAMPLEDAYDYIGFEDRFRGDESAIHSRQETYLDLFRNLQGPIVDLGCGRGEFLGVLRDAGIEARGVDSSAEMVGLAREVGLEIEHADLFPWLEQREDESIGGIFLAQVVEHLTPAQLLRLVELASDKLAPGGRFLAETVNPQTLGVFSHVFYMDLAHVKPVHPLTLTFLLERFGFRDIDAIYSVPFPEEARLTHVPEDVPGAAVMNANADKLNAELFGPQDYAVHGRRPPAPSGCDDGR